MLFVRYIYINHRDFVFPLSYYSYCSHDFLSSRLHRAGKCSIMLEHNAINLATTTSITNPSLGQNSKTKRSMQHFESTAKYLNSKTNKLGVADLMFCCKTPTYIEVCLLSAIHFPITRHISPPRRRGSDQVIILCI
eukprot:sb/3474664/